MTPHGAVERQDNRGQDNRGQKGNTVSGVSAYLPILVLLAFVAFLLTGFGTDLGATPGVWQPIPVYLFLCLALLTLQEHIAENRSIAHRTYVLLASSFAVIYAGEIYFAVQPLDFTHAPMTYLVAEVALLVVFLGDTAARHRAQTLPTTPSGRYGRWAIDLAGLAVFFFGSAFLLDLLGKQVVLQLLGLRIGQPPYVAVDLNQLFHLQLVSPVNTLEGLNLVLGLATTALALGLLTVAGVVLPSTGTNTAQANGVRSWWAISRDGVVQTIAALRLVAGPLIWLIPAFSVAAFADHVAQYFNASARTPSTMWDLFNPLSPTSRGNIALGIGTLLLGVLAVAAMTAGVAILETSADAIRHTLATLRDAARALTLTWALFMYSLAAINAVAILLGVTKATPFQVGAPGLLALLLGFGFLLYESTRGHVASPQHASPLKRTAPLTSPPRRSTPQQTTPRQMTLRQTTARRPSTPAGVGS
jgi:hypothetical protein